MSKPFPRKVRLPRIGKGRNTGKVTVAEFVGGAIAVKAQLPPDAVTLGFQEIGGMLQDLQPVLTLYAEYMVNTHIPRQFSTQGKAGGRPWRKLKEPYATWKLKHYGRLPILVLTGQMRDSFSFVVNKRSMRLTNPRKYWIYHQYGTRNMTARPLVVITKKDTETLEGMGASYIDALGEMWRAE